MKITKEQLKQIIKEELGKNYRLGEYQLGSPTILSIDFRNLKDVGENMPGGVDPEEIDRIIRAAVYEWEISNIKVDDKGGGGYRDPSNSKYHVFLEFESEWEKEDFEEHLKQIMQQVNDEVKEYEMKLRQHSLRDVTTGNLFENKIKITKEQLKQIIKEELALVKEGEWMSLDPHHSPGTDWKKGRPEYEGPTAEEETHRNRVQQGSEVLSSKMASLVSDAYKLADDMGRDEARKMFIAAGEELQTMTSPSDNPATKLVIEQLKFLLQPGVLMTEIGQAMTAFDE